MYGPEIGKEVDCRGGAGGDSWSDCRRREWNNRQHAYDKRIFPGATFVMVKEGLNNIGISTITL
jgi:hypothetical protein